MTDSFDDQIAKHRRRQIESEKEDRTGDARMSGQLIDRCLDKKNEKKGK